MGIVRDKAVKIRDAKYGDIADKTSVPWPLWLINVVHYLDSTNSEPHGVRKRGTLLDKGGQIKHRFPEIEER